MPELTLDVYDGEAFRPVTLTGWVNQHVPFQPTFLSSLGLFQASGGVYTTDVAFDDENGSLRLIKTTPRGSAPEQSQGAKGQTRKVPTVRLAREAVITADQVAGVRVLGSTMLQSAQRLVNQRIEGPLGLKAELSYTFEHMQLGAVDGAVYDADNSTVIWDYFSIYGVSRPSSVALPIKPTATLDTPLKKALTALKRSMVAEINGLVTSGARIVILCGDTFFDDVDNCPEVVAARKIQATGNSNAPTIIADNKAYSSFVYGDCVFVNYRGSEDAKVAVPADGGRAFFMGVPGLFQSFFAPADTWDFVNTEGLPSYLLQRRERQTESSRAFELQSNPLFMNMRPKHTRRLTINAS